MTQSGQGEEPSARPAHEGIVLPSDGGAPLLPSDLPPAPVQPWTRQWEPQEAPAPPAAPPADHWNNAPQPEWGGQQGTYDTYGAYGAQNAQGAQGTQGGAPLPPVAGEVSLSSAAVPPRQPQSAPLPPLDEGVTQYIPPVPSAGGMPMPASKSAPMDEGVRQYIPPVAAAAPVEEAATQFLPPVGPGALPPEAASDATTFLGRVPNGGAGPLPPAGNPDAQATQYIPPVAAAQPRPQQQSQPYGMPQQQPDVFDSLFRSEPGGEGVGGATQQLPRVEAPYAAQPPQGPGGRAAARRESGGGGGRTRSKVPLIALVGVGIAVLGIGAGALMATGSGDTQSQGDNKPVAATGAEPAESAAASADPAKEQAVALDKLLADSGDSRSSVIKAVGNIRACTNLGQAATDLRAAATQRTDLVTRLGELSVDKLPDHAALTTALTKAWQASASADNHYAAWADQAAGKKGCKKGQARSTGQTQAGNEASATASTQKNKAAQLWNSIASTYGLTTRQAVQL